MLKLTQRNLKLYFTNRSGVMLSLMGAMISFVLYLVFLKHNMVSNWQQVPDLKQILDPWLIGGTLTITAVTTTANGLSQMIKDRESGGLQDLLLTAPSFAEIQISYLMSAAVIGTVMQMMVLGLMSLYFSVTDAMTINLDLMVPLLLTALLSSIVWTAINMLLFSFIRNVDSLSRLSTIIGTAAGFFAGVYMPIGMLPTSAQRVIEFTPAPYNAAIYREILLKTQLNHSFRNADASVLSHFKKTMGIGVNLNGLTSIAQNALIMSCFTIATIIAILMVAKLFRKSVIQRN